MDIKNTVDELIKLKSESLSVMQRDPNLPDSLKISELQPMGISAEQEYTRNRFPDDQHQKIHADDLMLVSNPLQQNVFRSYRMEYKYLSANMRKVISCLPNTTLAGRWTVKGRMTLPTKRIVEDDDHQVVNCDWLSTHFMRELRELSSEIYEKDHIQSFIGEIIFSTTLKTEEQVRKRYGKDTAWDRVEGRFIMSTTSRNMVGKTAGDTESYLTLSDTPRHSHAISFANNTKTYRLNWTIPLTPSTICAAKEQSKGTDVTGSMADGWTMLKLDRNLKEDMLWTSGNIQAARDNGWADGRVIVAYGRGKSHGEGHAWILANKGEGKAHNNIPPFYTVHVWKRVK